jgi:hypothetical protein
MGHSISTINLLGCLACQRTNNKKNYILTWVRSGIAGAAYFPISLIPGYVEIALRHAVGDSPMMVLNALRNPAWLA